MMLRTRRTLRVVLQLVPALGLGLAVSLSASDAGAHPNITGYSGKPYNGVSETCTTNCHAAGANPPTLTITVPSTVQAGSTSQVTLVVAGNRVRTSMNAAFTSGVKTTKGTNTDTPLPAQEPTEVAAVAPPPSGASATYRFSFTAPSVPGPITMYVAGMAASGAGSGGDAVATTTRTIMVTGGDAGTTTDGGGGVDASTSSGGTSSGGTSGSTGSSGGTSADAGGSSGTSNGQAASPDDGSEGGGCSVRARAARDGDDTSLFMLSVTVGLAAMAWRRRRERS